MSFFKAPDNSIHFLDDDAFAYLLPSGCSPISAEQAEEQRIANLPPTPVPTSLTMRQARLALLSTGLLDTVEKAMASQPKAAQIEWEFAATVDRGNALVTALATTLNLDSAALDQLFIHGAAL